MNNMRNKILSLLVLLLTAATGAWAQEPVAKDIVVSPESGTNISDAIKDALGTNGDWALNITINLAKGGTYTITEPIVPSASIIINGNDATIDAKEFTDHFIKMRKTPSYDKVESGQYVVRTPSKIENVTITGLTKSLFYDNGAPYVFEDFTFDNCLINYLSQGSIIINLAASTVINFTIKNSTFYSKDKTTSSANCIALSGKRPWQVTGFEDSEGKLLVDHNTFYNVAYKKQFFNTNTLKGQHKYKYEFNSNIFVNVSNMKIYGNLTNNNNQLTTDGKNTYLWDGTFFSEINLNGDEGLKSDPLFKDADNGDFTLDRRSLQYKNSTGDPLWFNPKVTINDNQTEASFEMPASDVTVDYELVRDMQDETNPVAFSGLPSSGNIVVKKGSDGKYQPAEALTIQLIDPLAAAEAQNIIAADGITIKVLVGAENEKGAIDYDQENPITLEAFLADIKPGYYWIKAESTDENSPYDGTVYSSEFTVVEKYDLTVKPANDFSKGKIDKVVVGTEEITPDATTGEATKTGIAPDTEVKIKAKKGYIIEKVEAKKTSTPN